MSYQPPSFEVDRRDAWDLRRRTEIIQYTVADKYPRTTYEYGNHVHISM